MHVSRGRIVFLLIVVAVFFGWKNLSRSSQEIAVLHFPGVNNRDTYITLWVVEDGRNLWVRAESPRRLWLELLDHSPRVELRRDGSTRAYRATLYDTADARSYVDPMFRGKYGLADELRSRLMRRSTVPIRLEPI